LLAFDFATNGVACGDKTELMLLSLAIAATNVAAWGDRTVLWLDTPELAAISCFNALGASILLNVSSVGMDVVGRWSGLWFEG
jgi:hypothetical protein